MTQLRVAKGTGIGARILCGGSGLWTSGFGQWALGFWVWLAALVLVIPSGRFHLHF